LFVTTKISITAIRFSFTISKSKAEDTKVSQKMKWSNFQSKSKEMEDIEQ